MQININDKELMLFKNGASKKISEWMEEEIVVPDSKPDVMQIISVNVTPYVLILLNVMLVRFEQELNILYIDLPDAP